MHTTIIVLPSCFPQIKTLYETLVHHTIGRYEMSSLVKWEARLVAAVGGILEVIQMVRLLTSKRCCNRAKLSANGLARNLIHTAVHVLQIVWLVAVRSAPVVNIVC